jgi:RNA polymerase sigma-70 factor (ECF subfamily)
MKDEPAIPAPDDGVTTFEALRPWLIRVAYRMLGSWSDAEDIVQEAFLRWNDADRAIITRADAWLRRVVLHLCLDHLKSARHRRETYAGPWLPEPAIEDGVDDVDDVTLPLLLALERLSPLERAAFLLHDVFGLAFDEIGETIGRQPATCRQLAARARQHIRSSRPRFHVDRQRGLQIAQAFFAASRKGDLEALRTLLAADVVACADGGGQVVATPHPIHGIEAVIDLHRALGTSFARRSQLVRYGFVNGLPGFVSIEAGDVLQTTALEIANDRIAAVYVVRNPDKLQRVRAVLPPGDGIMPVR